MIQTARITNRLRIGKNILSSFAILSNDSITFADQADFLERNSLQANQDTCVFSFDFSVPRVRKCTAKRKTRKLIADNIPAATNYNSLYNI